MVELKEIPKVCVNAADAGRCQNLADDSYLMALRLMDMGFTLGGSRRMAQKYPQRVIPKADADWDLYVSWSLDALRTLKMLGFYEKSVDRNYRDNSAAEIWEHKSLRVQVVLRINTDRYREMFESLTVGEYLRIWKSNPDCPVENLPAFYAMVREFINCKLREF